MLNNTGERGSDKILGGFYEGEICSNLFCSDAAHWKLSRAMNCIVIMTSYFIHLWNKKKD